MLKAHYPPASSILLLPEQAPITRDNELSPVKVDNDHFEHYRGHDNAITLVICFVEFSENMAAASRWVNDVVFGIVMLSPCIFLFIGAFAIWLHIH